jgi:hypothetical protein
MSLSSNIARSGLAEGLTKKVSKANALVPELLQRLSFESPMVENMHDGVREHPDKGLDLLDVVPVGSFVHERLTYTRPYIE